MAQALRRRLRLRMFEGFGVEIEYMIVDRESLEVLPVADEVLRRVSGRIVNSYDSGAMGWSNEFVLHLIEIKNSHPSPGLAGLADAFMAEVRRINRILRPLGGRLMPTGMHPWMSPERETRLWPHRNKRIYSAYDRIFGCRSHGWANVQSTHLNIAFRGDREFGALHSAVRMLLPLMPALAASSPVAEGRITGIQDTRLSYYARNQRSVPSISGRIVPESVLTKADYEERILGRMYRDMAAVDPGGMLTHEWLNSRGAIPRFERGAIEIRVLDTQEFPGADLAIAALIVDVLKALVGERWISSGAQARWGSARLVDIYRASVRSAERARIGDREYLRAFGYPEKTATAGELWEYLAEATGGLDYAREGARRGALGMIIGNPLSRRIIRSLGGRATAESLRRTYRRLCDCLQRGEPFIP